MQEVGMPLRLIKLEVLFGEVEGLRDTVRTLIWRDINTLNFKKLIKYILKKDNKEWLELAQEWVLS